uniref:Uncharacterized protein LOC111123603 n=1 Tax=Crassostrea virginica TaxID=6565 RepID=A0A8B8D138_CRAVI|nr:uncharacterized protein LOC111123603 [Crassostrea virginica]
MAIYYLLILGLLTRIPCIIASHFRGGLLTWTAENASQIIVHHRLSYVYSHCSNNSVNNTLNCISGCSNSATMIGYCTDSDASENWMDSEGITRFDITDPTSQILALGFTGGGWISLIEPSPAGYWSFKMTVDLTTRTDTGKINQSPITSIASSFKLDYNCFYILHLYIPGMFS